jgi:uncharacterized protein YjbI with pentapeptide repeats
LGLEPPKPESSAPAALALGARPPPEPAGTADPRDFLKKADDLEAIKQAVDDAASVGGGLWLSYLFVLFYLAIAAGAVTHADLFLENPVKLPFLNVELPLLAFFFLAPILFLFVHAYTLVHLVFLTDKAKRFDQALSAQIGDDSVVAKAPNDPRVAAIAGIRGQLPSNIFIQFLAGPRDRRGGSFGWLLRLIAWSTLAVSPILLLLLLQLQFLPFHLSWITWTHRLALTVDFVLLWCLWRMILSGRDSVTPQPVAVWGWRGIGAFLTALVVLFSWFVATFPGEAEHDLLAKWDASGRAVSLRNQIFQSDVDGTTRRRVLPLSNTLVLTGFNIYEGLNIDDPDKLKGRDFIFRARGRNLRGAIFDFAVLPKVDFTGTELEGASLPNVQLQGASLDHAQLQGALLLEARLQGASLIRAQLQGASLSSAKLQGAALTGAWLEGAGLWGAQLQGVSLDLARLKSAVLLNAQLQGASLAGTQLEGASLVEAHLQGATLELATLEATDLSGAYLWRTNRKTSSSKVTATRMSGDESWRPIWGIVAGYGYVYLSPRPWDDKAYRELRTMIEAVTPGSPRDNALVYVSDLDCADPNPSLASCDPNVLPPPEATAWREAVEAARVDDQSYFKSLARVLKDLICSGDDNAIYVLRGFAFQDRLKTAGVAATELIDDLMNKDSKNCPVAVALTDDDRARLLQIKQQIELTPRPAGASPG